MRKLSNKPSEDSDSNQKTSGGFFSGLFSMGGRSNTKQSDTQFSLQQMQSEIDEFDREIKMLNELQKQYS